jgi:hypothetical protein
MLPRAIQYLLAAVFFGLGGWCVISPESVLDLSIRPAFRAHAPIEAFLIGAFGAQALIAALFAATARFTRTTFLAYGLGLIPFFVFDYWFYAVTPVLTEVGLLDAVGNVIMLALCVIGWRRAEPA